MLQVHAETLKFTVDCQQPAEDTIIEPKDTCYIARDEGSFWENARGCPAWVKDFEKFLANKIKDSSACSSSDQQCTDVAKDRR